MTDLPPSGKDQRSGWLTALLVLVAVALLLLTYRLDETPFRGLYDDVDRSLIARNMVDSGDWLVATYVNGPLYTKPPLMYWTAAGLGLLTGRSDELPGNLASVLGLFLVVLAVFWAGRNLFNTQAGLRAGLLLVTMHLFLAMGRQALLDTVMMGGFALSFGALIHLGFSDTRRTHRWWLLMALGLSLSFMTKGPVILPVFLLIWLPLLRVLPRLRPSLVSWLLALGLIALITLPWPVVLLRSAPEAVDVWKSEIFGRFGDGTQFHQWTQKPFWFYLPDLINTLPWVLLIPWAVAVAIKRRQDPRFRLLLWWSLGGLVFFSLASATKRSYYLLPLYPALALLVAGAWDRLAATKRATGAASMLPLLTLVLVGLLGAAMVALPFFFPEVDRPAFLIFGFLVMLFSLAALLAARTARWSRSLYLVIAGAACFHLAYFGHHVPPANTYFSGKPFFQEALPLIGDEEVTLLEVPLALSAFYLHHVPWRYVQQANLTDVMKDNPGGLVITRPETAMNYPDLVPLLQREFTEPFGKKKGLGLYRFRPTQPSSKQTEP